MAKKTREAEIKLPFIKFSWFKEINKPETNKDFIQSQIDSFILLVENKNKIKIGVYKEELKAFLSILPAQGHLSKLDKDYQEKYFKIAEYYKSQYNFTPRFHPL